MFSKKLILFFVVTQTLIIVKTWSFNQILGTQKYLKYS